MGVRCAHCRGTLIQEHEFGQSARVYCLQCGREAAGEQGLALEQPPRNQRHRTVAQLAAKRAKNRLAREVRVATSEGG